MASIFSGAGRIAVVVNDDGSIPLGLVVGTFKTALGLKGVLTTVQVSGQGGFQVMHTLRRAIYMYTFGERVGEITIGGLLVNADCNDAAQGTAAGSPNSGILRFFEWYEQNRVTTIGAPIAITIVPGLVLNGFLINMRFQVEDAAIPIAQFVLQFLYPPRIVTTRGLLTSRITSGLDLSATISIGE